MITVLTVVIVGFVIGRWFGSSVSGWKSYPLAVLVALIAVPAAGIMAAYADIWLFGGAKQRQVSIALGLGLAVALIEVPLLVFKRQRSRGNQGTGTPPAD